MTASLLARLWACCPLFRPPRHPEPLPGFRTSSVHPRGRPPFIRRLRRRHSGLSAAALSMVLRTALSHAGVGHPMPAAAPPLWAFSVYWSSVGAPGGQVHVVFSLCPSVQRRRDWGVFVGTTLSRRARMQSEVPCRSPSVRRRQGGLTALAAAGAQCRGWGSDRGLGRGAREPWARCPW